MEFSASLLPLAVDFAIMLPYVDHFLRQQCPAQNIVQGSKIGKARIELSYSGDGRKFVLPGLLKTDCRPLKRDESLRGANDGLQYPFQIQSRSDLTAHCYEHLQHFDLAFGQQ